MNPFLSEDPKPRLGATHLSLENWEYTPEVYGKVVNGTRNVIEPSKIRKITPLSLRGVVDNPRSPVYPFSDPK